MTRAKENPKKNVTIKLDPATINRLDAASAVTGLKKNTIIEQGLTWRLNEIEKAMRK